MDYREPSNIGNMGGITPAVKYLLILNVSIYFGEEWFGILFSEIFALPANWWQSFDFWQLFTYMFVHGNLSHLFMNMLGLFFIGPTVENTLGSYRFFILYYLSGILGGLGWSLIADPYLLGIISGHQVLEYPVCVGASGALMGVLGAFAALYPRAKLLLWFILPIRAWVLVLVLAAWELSEIIGKPKIGGIANAAHLVGGIAGFCYAFLLKNPQFLDEVKRKGLKFLKTKPKGNYSSSRGKSLSKAEIDAILEKIGKEGMGALSAREREILKRATRG